MTFAYEKSKKSVEDVLRLRAKEEGIEFTVLKSKLARIKQKRDEHYGKTLVEFDEPSEVL